MKVDAVSAVHREDVKDAVVKRFETMTRASATSTQQSYQVQGFPLQRRSHRYLSLISAGLLLRS
jgi:hypothetical protein